MPLPFDVTADTLLSATQLAKHLNVAGGPSVNFRRSLTRWITKGVAVCGKKLTLRASRNGGRWLVRWGDYVEFRDRCTRAAGVDQPRMQSPAEFKREAARARAEWQQMLEDELAKNRKTRTSPAQRKRAGK